MPGRNTPRKPKVPKKVSNQKVALAGQKAVKQALLDMSRASVAKKKI